MQRTMYMYVGIGDKKGDRWTETNIENIIKLIDHNISTREYESKASFTTNVLC